MSTSTPLTRWGGPAAMIWVGLMLSAWVHSDKLSEADAGAARLAAVMLAVPTLQVVLLVGLRRVLDRRGAGRGADLVVLWLMTFLFGLHAAVLATAIGMLDSIGRAVPVAVGLLMFGLGPGLTALEPGSPLGIRTRSTLASTQVWRRVHRFAAGSFLVAGLIAPFGLLFEGLDALYVAVAPALLAVSVSILRGGIKPPPEDEAPAERPTPDEGASDASEARAP